MADEFNFDGSVTKASQKEPSDLELEAVGAFNFDGSVTGTADPRAVPPGDTEGEPSIAVDIATQVGAALADTTIQLGKLTTRGLSTLSDTLPDWFIDVWFAGSPYAPLKSDQRAALTAQLGGQDPYQFALNELAEKQAALPEAETLAGEITRPVARFLTALVPAGAITKTAGASSALRAGAEVLPVSARAANTISRSAGLTLDAAIAENIAFEPYEARLSNLLADVPVLGPAFDAIKADPDDPEALARAKMTIEGIGLGYAADGLVRAFRGAAKAVRGGNLTKPGQRPRDVGSETLPPESDLSALLGTRDRAVRARVSVMEEEILDRLDPSDVKTLDAAENVYRAEMARQDPEGTIFPDDLREKLISRFRARATDAKRKPRADEPAAATQPIAASRAEVEKSNQVTGEKMLRRAESLFVDHAGGVKSALLRDGGVAGQKAVKDFELAAGAPAHSDAVFNGARADIYRPLSIEPTSVRSVATGQMSPQFARRLDDVLTLRRSLEISQSRPDVTLPNNAGPKSFVRALAQIRDEVGPEAYDELTQRANLYFEHMREQLFDLFESGVIGRAEFEKLNRFDYMPREFLEQVDPTNKIQLSKGEKPISVSESGIEPLGKTLDEVVNTDSQFLLANVISRVQGRIAKNEATRSLARMAAEVPDNGLVTLKKPNPKSNASVMGRWTRLSYRDAGKKQSVWIDSDFAKQWATREAPLSRSMANALTISSGAPITRAMATGINPEFALVNVPRDIVFSWLTTPEFSAVLPKALAQYGRNLAVTFPDAVLRKGRYQDYLREGGGMSFLTHGARLHAAGQFETPVGPAGLIWERARTVLGYINETSEIAIRLTLRDQALRNGKTASEATWAARRYLDFSQGGTVTKGFDTAIPYINASVQGLRGAVRAAKKDPLLFTGKLSQLVGVTGSLWAYNHYFHKDTMSQISQEEQSRFWHFPTGMSYTDNKGNKRHVVARIPLDHTVMPFKAATDYLMAASLTRDDPTYRLPEREVLAALSSSLTVLGDPGTAMPPTLRAFVQYLSNYDFWTNDQIWKGPEVEAAAEVAMLPSEPTPQLAVDIGQALGLSPTRLRSAAGAVVPRNIFTTLFNNGFEAARGGPQVEQGMGKATLDMLRRQPFLRRLVTVTHPLANSYHEIEDASKAENTKRFQENQTVDRLATLAVQAGAPLGRGPQFNELRDYMKQNVNPLDHERLIDRFQRQQFVQKNVDRFKDLDFGPNAQSPSWWVVVGGMPPVARAEIAYLEWRATVPEKRRSFERIMAALPGSGGQRFWAEFARLKRIEGDNYP